MTKEEEEAVRRLLKELREKKGPPAGGAGSEVSSPAPARLSVSLPADARLWVDDTVCPLTGGTRAFNTPELQPGRQYYYTLRMEVVRDGQTVTMSRRVDVAAGQAINVDLNDMSTATVRR